MPGKAILLREQIGQEECFKTSRIPRCRLRSSKEAWKRKGGQLPRVRKQPLPKSSPQLPGPGEVPQAAAAAAVPAELFCYSQPDGPRGVFPPSPSPQPPLPASRLLVPLPKLADSSRSLCCGAATAGRRQHHPLPQRCFKEGAKVGAVLLFEARRR